MEIDSCLEILYLGKIILIFKYFQCEFDTFARFGMMHALNMSTASSVFCQKGLYL